MAKKDINLGTAVDTGTGDYLRRGGSKLNDNFTEVYDRLGDGVDIQPSNLGIIYHSATDDGTVLNAVLGQIYAIDTTSDSVTVNMPSMSDTDVGRSVTFMDPYGTWNTNGVTFVADSGDSFGVDSEIDVQLRFAKPVFTYTDPSTWLYNPGQRIDRFTDVAEASRIERTRKITAAEQTDFTNIFPTKYNDAAIDVIVNGSHLYYGDALNADSDFGSIGGNPGELIALNGFDIRLREPVEKGDIVKFVTFLRSTGTTPTSSESHAVKVIPDTDPDPEIDGEVVKRNLNGDTIDITISEMGGNSVDVFNIDATNVFVNGQKLTKRGDSGLPLGTCSLSQYDDEDTCVANGGTWTQEWNEFGILYDGNDQPNGLRISTGVLNTSGDNFIFAQTFNFQLGTLSSLEDVVSETDSRYMKTIASVTRTNKISYSDIADPSNETAQDVPGTESTRFDNYNKLLESIYPVGSLYFNAHNPANPADYMGFGTWVLHAKGRAIVGWDDRTDLQGDYDPDFGLNNNDLDEFGQPQASAGATRGQKTITLSASNIPLLAAAGKWLKKAAGGTGFFKNYGDTGQNINPASSYNEETLEVGNQSPSNITNIQPSITVYCWVRVQ